MAGSRGWARRQEWSCAPGGRAEDGAPSTGAVRPLLTASPFIEVKEKSIPKRCSFDGRNMLTSKASRAGLVSC